MACLAEVVSNSYSVCLLFEIDLIKTSLAVRALPFSVGYKVDCYAIGFFFLPFFKLQHPITVLPTLIQLDLFKHITRE